MSPNSLIAQNREAIYSHIMIPYFIAASILILMVFIVCIVALWKIFVKAGEKGWKAIIPIYNVYILCKLTWSPKFFWMQLIATILLLVFSSLPGGPAKFVFSILTLVLSIFLLVTNILGHYRVSKSFGHGIPFTIGLFLFNVVFVLILGLGSSQYKGNVYLQSKNPQQL